MEHGGRSTSNTIHDTLAPNSLKTVVESKLRAFEQGSVAVSGRPILSRKERDDLRARAEAHETEEVLKEFVAAFEEPKTKSNKTFVKGGVFNPGSHEETPTDRGKTYRTSDRKSDSTSNKDVLQQQIAKSNAAALAAAASLSTSLDTKPKFKTEREKRKSNLEAFKEELKRNQEERDRRRMQKHRDKDSKSQRFQSSLSSHSDHAPDSESSHHENRHTSDDPNTTNLFISTIPRAMNEMSIMELFGRYGPLASVKIMYPRSEEEKSRGTNCGFVAYMSRKDAERAMQELSGSQIDSIAVRMSWGRAVHIPPQPVYIPPSLRELIMPPPPSGLPFNAQLNAKNRSSRIPEINHRDSESLKFLEQATVRVTIPHDRNILCLIHRMIEFVIREGPLFEAMIMRREINNPQFRFLFDNQSPVHTYYRWKLYSILQGDTITSWRTDSFRLFKGGSLWLPPQPQQFTSGMPDEVFEKVKKEDENDSDLNVPVITKSNNNNNHYKEKDKDKENNSTKRGRLSQKQRDQFEDLLRNLTPERTKIGEAMLWAIDHAEAADEIIDCITESLAISQTPVPKKISRLYLVSDILFNCSAKVTNASHYRRGFEMRLPDIFQSIHEAWSAIDGRLRAEQFKQKVMSSFRAWESWAIYPSDFLIKLQNIFLGLVRQKPTIEIEEKKSTFDDDIDGKPINSDTLDNRPLALVADYDDEEDIDGKPISNRHDDIDGRPMNTPSESRPRFQEESKETISSTTKARFVPTKWQSIDPNEVAAQAVTISKWDFDQESAPKSSENFDEDCRISFENINETNTENVNSQDLSNSDMSEERRQKLRDVEIQVLKYTDDLESGRRQPSQDFSIGEDIEIYRQNLLKKIDEDDRSSFDFSKQINSSRYSQQRSIDEKNQETNSRRDDSSSRHRSMSARNNSSNSNQSENSVKPSKPSTDHHHYQSKRKRDDRSPSPTSRHSSRSNRH